MNQNTRPDDEESATAAASLCGLKRPTIDPTADHTPSLKRTKINQPSTTKAAAQERIESFHTADDQAISSSSPVDEESTDDRKVAAAAIPHDDDVNNEPTRHQTSDDEYKYWMSKIEEARWFESRDVLKIAPYHIRDNRIIVMAAVQKNGYALQYVSPSLQNDKEVVMAAIKRNGVSFSYQYAAPRLQNDREVAIQFVKGDCDNIRIIPESLKRDPGVLVAAGMFDAVHDDAVVREQRKNTRRIVLSTRFSLNEGSYSEATHFTTMFKKSEYIKRLFTVYAPNAFDKRTCDEQWTRFDWPCRGTPETCKYNNVLNDGHPTDDCCWRFSFRRQLQEAKETQGFMVQLVETGEEEECVDKATLGMGQRIELDMANTMGIKVFHVYRPEGTGGIEAVDIDDYHIDFITEQISHWYDNKCQDMSVTTIRQSYDDYDTN